MGQHDRAGDGDLLLRRDAPGQGRTAPRGEGDEGAPAPFGRLDAERQRTDFAGQMQAGSRAVALDPTDERHVAIGEAQQYRLPCLGMVAALRAETVELARQGQAEAVEEFAVLTDRDDRVHGDYQAPSGAGTV